MYFSETLFLILKINEKKNRENTISQEQNCFVFYFILF